MKSNNGTLTVQPESIEDTKKANPDSKIFHALLDAIPLDKLNEALMSQNIDSLLKTNLTLKPNDDPHLAQFILDFANIKKLLNNPVRIGVSSQNAITTEFLIDEKQAIASGIFIGAFGGGGIDIDKNHSALIAGDGGHYFKITGSGQEITMGSADEAEFRATSVMSPEAYHKLTASMIMLNEMPVGYSYKFLGDSWSVSLGASAKIIHAIFERIQKRGNFDEISNDLNITFNPKPQINAALDLGAFYEYKKLGVGLSAKYLNAPKFSTNNGEAMRIYPQIRAGVSYEGRKFVAAFDTDLAPNDTFMGRKSLFFGGGAQYRFGGFGLSGGAMFDAYAINRPIFTLGASFWRWFELSLQYGFNGERKITDIPSYFRLQLGGSVKM